MHILAAVLSGFLTARGTDADRPRFDQPPIVAQLGATFEPRPWLEAHVAGIAHDEHAGIVEAHATLKSHGVHLRVGQFFLPTSRENRGALWTSPYTIGFSSLNTWIGEEVRPVGADLSWHGDTFSTGATAFRGNDTMGTLLAWRGWAMGNRLSTFGEVRELPELHPAFALQRDGTKPIGRDLDGRTGFAGRARWTLPERAMVQVAYVDNRGDRELHEREYAWATRYTHVSAEAGHHDRVLVAAEYVRGTTGMGVVTGAHVDADFSAGYLLVTGRLGRNRWSGRVDRFETVERDFSIAENNDENGLAWTLTWLYDLTQSLRGGAEFTQLSGERASASFNERSVTVELRYVF
jgi:hypothetical protein